MSANTSSTSISSAKSSNDLACFDADEPTSHLNHDDAPQEESTANSAASNSPSTSSSTKREHDSTPCTTPNVGPSTSTGVTHDEEPVRKRRRHRKNQSDKTKSAPKKSRKSRGRKRQGNSTSNTESQHNVPGTSAETATSRNAENSKVNSTPTGGENGENQETSQAVSTEASNVASVESLPPSSSTAEVSPDNERTPAQNSPGTSAGSSDFRKRFNRRNERVITLRHASELIVGQLYMIYNVQRVNTRFGPSLRAEIADERSPVLRSFLFLPSRFRDTSDDDIRSMNEAASQGQLYLVYRGRIGKADIIDIV